jgi:hypothetical protein
MNIRRHSVTMSRDLTLALRPPALLVRGLATGQKRRNVDGVGIV